MKLIFHKDWNQIGCKAFSEGTSLEQAKEWLSSNHQINNIIKIEWVPL